MKAGSSLPAGHSAGDDFDIDDIFRASDMADLVADIQKLDSAYIAVISSDGESCRLSTLGDISRVELLGLLALADEAVRDYEGGV